MNFLQETKQAVKESGHKQADVMFIGSKDGEYRMDWKKFCKNADFEYDEGYGSPHIAIDLIIYFTDHTYIVRNEYDGSEWWEYNVPKLFNEDDKYFDFEILGNNTYMWGTVRELNLNKELKNE